MAHHCQEHWASQQTWQTVPSVAAGQRSAGSGIWAPQSEQVGIVGSGIGLLLGQPSLYGSERLCRHLLIGGGVPSVLGPASRRLNIPVWKSAEKIKNRSFIKR